MKFADDPAKYFRCLFLVEIRVVPLLYSDLRQGEMQVRLHVMAFEATQYAMKRTTVDGDDLPARLGNAHEGGDVTANAGNARHFRMPLAIQTDRDMVRHLRRARAARARVNDRPLGILSRHLMSINVTLSRRRRHDVDLG
jgi:hypothetical protein